MDYKIHVILSWNTAYICLYILTIAIQLLDVLIGGQAAAAMLGQLREQWRLYRNEASSNRIL